MSDLKALRERVESATCDKCSFWRHRGHMLAAGGIERHYGTCTNSANDVRMSVGFEQSEPMHDMKWSWATCPRFAALDGDTPNV